MREKKLEGIRLFPLDRRIIKEGDLEFNQFPQILAYWRSKDGPFGGKVPNKWKNFYAEISQAA
jgi:intracellular multiplication protein IcmJ